MTALALSPAKIALKRATRDMVRAVGGFEVAELNCRIGKSSLHRQADDVNEACARDFVSIDVVADLEPLGRGQAGWPQVTRALAGSLGFALVALPAAQGGGAVDWHGHIAALTGELNDIVSGLCRALADDRRVSAGEASGLLPETDQAIRVIVDLRAALEAARDAGCQHEGRL